MLSLNLTPPQDPVPSDSDAQIEIELSSTRDSEVTVVFHFPSPDAQLTPHVTTLKPKKVDASRLFSAQFSFTTTLKAKRSAWFTLTGTATDGDSKTDAETLISVKR
jgi:hypothetical protein